MLVPSFVSSKISPRVWIESWVAQNPHAILYSRWQEAPSLIVKDTFVAKENAINIYPINRYVIECLCTPTMDHDTAYNAPNALDTATRDPTHASQKNNIYSKKFQFVLYLRLLYIPFGVNHLRFPFWVVLLDIYARDRDSLRLHCWLDIPFRVRVTRLASILLRVGVV